MDAKYYWQAIPTILHPTTGAPEFLTANIENRNLDLDTIHGVYITYIKDGITYYSAREAYVWTSNRSARDDERIATIPLTHRLNNRAYANPRTYAYRVCFSLFDPTDDRNNIPASVDLDKLKSQWTKMVEHAFSQWQTATDGFVVMDRLDDQDVRSDGQLLYECGVYDKAIKKAAAFLQKGSFRAC